LLPEVRRSVSTSPVVSRAAGLAAAEPVDGSDGPAPVGVAAPVLFVARGSAAGGTCDGDSLITRK
jgi:hypothetical protein